MDVNYFLKKRTSFIRFYYDAAAKPFSDRKDAIENHQAPFDNPGYSDDGEPPFLDAWMDSDAARKVLGLSCVSLLSDSLKLYFHTLQTRVIWFGFEDKTGAFRNGFLAAYLEVLQEILDTDWSDCPADLGVIEQIVLARNRGQHAENIRDFDVTHDTRMMTKYPNAFFASEDELKSLPEWKDGIPSYLLPEVEVTREKLFRALEEVEKLADYIESRIGKADEWRMRSK